MDMRVFYLSTAMTACSCISIPGRIAQSVTCLTADQGVASLIPAWCHTVMEIVCVGVVVSYKRKYVLKVLCTALPRLHREKSD